MTMEQLRLWGVRFRPPPEALAPQHVVRAFPQSPGLYVHIPFCSRLCPFCPYNKVPYQPAAASAYVPALRQELDSYTDRWSEPFTSLYVGGGTPTLALRSLAFLADIRVSGERAMEILPSHMTPRIAGELRRSGFGAVSIGVQSFHDRILRHLQRPTNAATNRRAVALAREEFDCVDVDLIFDVAYDGPGALLRDLEEAFAFGVDQVSTYPLMRFGYTPFGKAPHERRAEHDLLRRAADLAASRGYHRDSVWTFVRDGSPTYTSITRPYYLGVGAGAATFAGDLFAVNHFGLSQYGAAVEEGRLPIALLARLPSAAATAYRAFWQGYTGQFRAGDDPVLEARWLAGSLRVAAAVGLLRRTGDGGYRMTPRGYDVYHDAERAVTYGLIEPLWGRLMAEHDAA
jgi:coproporphyrinogen III oxidase-like Fe-S oxidoreductase